MTFHQFTKIMHLRLGFLLPSLLFASLAASQSPDAALAALPQDQQAWVNRTCTRSLGPSLWASCVQRETSALRRGIPDLSTLNDSDRTWVQRSCPTSLGPSLTISCLSRELNAIRAGMPKLEGLPSDKRAWVLQSCPQSLGPTLFRSCVQRESRAAVSGPSPSATSPIPPPRVVERARGARGFSGSPGASRYTIETSHNDELFIINGERFESKTYCFNMEEDDEVIFLDGSPFGACVSATLLNLRTRDKCEVWCE
jgi:hypothetical protein